MTEIDITPESLDAHADWVFETGIDASVAHVLREAAAVMRHEQADNERIDWLLAEYHEARIAAIKTGDDYADRVGMRAVLAKLDEEKTDPEAGGPNDHSTFVRWPRQWDDLRDVPADVRNVSPGGGLVAYRSDSANLGWRWRLPVNGDQDVSESGLVHGAPFTEVLDGAL